VINAARWYQVERDLKNFYQGDILSGVPFTTLPTFLSAANEEKWGILRPRINKNRPDPRPTAEIMRNLPNELIGRAAKDLVDIWSSIDGEHIIAHCSKTIVMLVSRSCDVDKLSRKHFLVAPVVAIASLQEEQRKEDKLKDLRANGIFHWFYLPAHGDLPESYADLSFMQPIHRSFFQTEALADTLLARLSNEGTASLQVALSNFYGKQFGFSLADKCIQPGLYACSTCFYSGRGVIEKKVMKVGEYFGDRQKCGEDASWVLLPTVEAIRVEGGEAQTG